jgi:hypothetical protein
VPDPTLKLCPARPTIVWREIQAIPQTQHADIKPLPRAVLVPMNFFLLLVVIAAPVGIWST